MELTQIKAKYGSVGEQYRLLVPEIVAEASQVLFDLFNASGSNKVMIVNGVYAVPKGDVAVSGVVAIKNELYRTSAVGTGGTAATAGGSDPTVPTVVKSDTSDSDLPTGVTARKEPTGGATVDDLVSNGYVFSEETNAAIYAIQNQDLLRGMPVVLRPGQGLAAKQGSVASVNSYAYIVDFLLV